jgi:hypothetical protein
LILWRLEFSKSVTLTPQNRTATLLSGSFAARRNNQIVV